MIKYLVMLNNFTIDLPKTQYLLRLPDEIKGRYDEMRKALPPYFFQWAKGKKKVAELNGSIMGRVIECVNGVKNTRFAYLKEKEIDSFDPSKLQRCTVEGKIYGVDRYSSTYKSIHKKLYNIGEQVEKDIIMFKEKHKNARNSDQKKVDMERLNLRNAITLELLLNLCWRDEVMLANILIDIHYYQKPIKNLHNIIWDCVGNVLVENLKLNLGTSGYKPVKRSRKAYSKLSELIAEADQERERRKLPLALSFSTTFFERTHMLNEVYTVQDIQQILSISRNTAYSLMESPPFPIKRIGSAIRIPKEPFAHWLNSEDDNSEVLQA